MKSKNPASTCELTLSADGNWLRVIVLGKLTVTFNTKYVRKILEGQGGDL